MSIFAESGRAPAAVEELGALVGLGCANWKLKAFSSLEQSLAAFAMEEKGSFPSEIYLGTLPHFPEFCT